MELLLLPAVAAVPLIWALLTRRWQLTLYLVMLLMVFEGALRKWFFPGYQAQIYFLKDVLLLAALAGYIIARPPPGSHEPLVRHLKALLFISCCFFLLQIGNPNSPSTLVGLTGFKNYMLYAVLLFIVPYAFDSTTDLIEKLKFYMLCMIPVGLLALVQFSLPVDHFLNTYVRHDEGAQLSIAAVTGFGDTNYARTTGTFSYIGGFGTFLVAMFNLGLAFVIGSHQDFRRNIIPYALLGATTIAAFTTGSRGTVIGTLGTLPITLLIAMWAGLIRSQLMIRLAAVGGAIAIGIFYFALDAVEVFSHRTTEGDEAIARILSPFTQLLEAAQSTPIFGLGIGVNSNSTNSIMGVKDASEMWWLDGKIFEDETARVMQDVGLLGFALVYTVRLALIIWALRMALTLRTPILKALSVSIATFYIFHLPSQVIFNPTAHLYVWFAAGLLFAMHRFDAPRSVSTSQPYPDGHVVLQASPVASAASSADRLARSHNPQL